MVETVFSFGSHSSSGFLSFWRYGSDDLQITSQSTSHFTLTGAGYTVSIYGSFISGAPSISRVTGLEASYDGQDLVQISGMDMLFYTAMGFNSYYDLINLVEEEMEGDDRFVSDLTQNHYINSLGGNDYIATGTGNDRIDAGLGSDTVLTGAGDDYIFGSGGRDFLTTGSGDDTLSGGVGGDRMNGGGGHDVLIGGRGNDVLRGGAHNDVLVANTGNDRLIGGSGRDVFVFRNRDGQNTITDFGKGADRIEIEHGARSMDDLHFRQSGDDTIITFAQTTVIVQGWQVDDLQDDHFFLFT